MTGAVAFADIKARIAGALTSPIVGTLIRQVWAERIRFRHAPVFVPRSAGPSIAASVFWGIYESAEAIFVEKYLPPNETVVELGSSIGVVANVIARTKPKAMVCVEANSALIESISLNVGLSSNRPELQVVNKAIDYSGRTRVPFCRGNSTLTSAVSEDRPSSDSELTVPATTLSSILRDAQIDSYVLVMDIEGAEIGIIRKDVDSLQRCSLMIVELHRASFEGEVYEVDEMASWICGAGFRILDRRGPVFVFQSNRL